ncbi:hypothetical protein GGR54DRAFT_257903 [Hypoxylon sp. NC1633]|nr:hypothetical protein GGR54DRAFT_257903 [Hypoxylon sp. NC1633]
MNSPQPHEYEPVAIVGMGCRWPGGSHNSSEFWEFLCNKVDGWKKFDDPRFSARGFHHPNADRPGGFAMKGAFLAEDARLFDHSFFGITGLEVETMDPSQRKLLEVAYEAIENAGETWDSISGSRTGVFVGNFCLDHWMIQSRDWDNPRPYAFVGAGTSILANRISYVFNLRGPSLTIDTACSSSMYALHLAVNSIRAGDCDSAIVASANWIADPGVQIALDKLGALSASSRCHTFDAKADGYARGEGYGAIYLKRPSLAIADGSPIRAMIRGTAINSNGRTGGITRPSARGQETVIREAYRRAGNLPFKDTSYFECHGTGTYVGDPIEMAAVGNVFAPERSAEDSPLLVGSVKSNVGHGEGASALASIMKVVLALENKAIPPIFDLETRNPNIDFESLKVKPVTELTSWPKDRLRRASINSFGYGGANAHCIIDHVNNVLPDYVAPAVPRRKANDTATEQTNGHTNGHANGHTNGHYIKHQIDNEGVKSIQHRPIIRNPRSTAKPNAATRQSVLLPFSAHNEQSLQQNIAALSKVINKVSLANVAYTLGVRRSRLAQRSFCIVDENKIDGPLVVNKKPVRAPLQTVSLGFIFTGQGAQWHGMGAGLLDYRVFRTAIEYLDHVLGELPNPPTWSLYAILSGECDTDLVQTAEVSQATCTALQVGLVDLLASWSIRPSGVVGHSSGEIAAAYASGRITGAEAIVAAYLRGQAVSKNKHDGAMLAVGIGLDEVGKYIEGRESEVVAAAINSPRSVTLSGDGGAINEVSEAMTVDGVFNRRLKTGGNAYHSHHMIPIGDDYIKMLAEGTRHIQKLGLDSVGQRYPHKLWVSSVTTKRAVETDGMSSYWRANLEAPVRFSEAIAKLVQAEDVPIQILVEIGPHSALKSPLEQILKASGKTASYVSTLKRQQDARVTMLELAGTLFTLNATVDLAAVNAVDNIDGTGLVHGCVSTGLPPYKYTYGGLNYHESRASKEYRYRSVLRHDLLGSKVVGNAKLRPQWRNILRLKDIPWLGEHRLVPDAVLPGAAYVAMAVEASSRIYNEFPEPLSIEGFSLADMFIKKALTIPEDDYGVELMTSMELVDGATKQSPAWATFSISSVRRETTEWTEHCTGRVKVLVKLGDGKSEQQQVAVAPVPTTTPYAVDAGAWYKKFLEIGLGYGPAFQPLSKISSTTGSVSNVALATIDLRTTSIKGGESPYPLHPASLDGVIQLGLIACHGGRTNAASTAFVPVHLPQLFLSNEMNKLTKVDGTCTAVARGERRGVRGAHLGLKMFGPNGEVLLHAESVRCISYSSATKLPMDTAFNSPYTRLVWRPDIRTLSNRQARQMYPPPEVNVKQSASWGITNKLAHFVVVSMYESFAKLPDRQRPKPSGEVGHFFDWIQRMGRDDQSELTVEARGAASQESLTQAIDELVAQAPQIIEVKVAKLLHDNIADILYERRTGMDIIISEGLLTPLYESGLLMTGIYPQLHRVLAGLSHANPNLRVLEIGGGTGGATRIAMRAFNGPNGIKAYGDYTFTDISAGFLSKAHKAMADLRDISFSVFDIEGDPVDQGYLEQTYDLIIACQVLHATSNMKRTLTNCRRLLKPGGKLVMVETNQNFIVPGVVVGTFTGYWAGIPDGRVDAPFQSLPAWDRALRDAGFSGLDIVLDDFPEPHNTTSVILSTVPSEIAVPDPYKPATVHILHGRNVLPPLVKQISKELEQRGVIAKVGTFDSVFVGLGPGSRIVAILDDKHLLVGGNDREFNVFQHLARNAASLVTLTSCGIVKGRSADGALISGLLRVLQNENPAAQHVSIDIDADNFDLGDDELGDLARCIVDSEFSLHDQDTLDISGDLEGNPTDREFSWQDGCMWVSRHIPDGGFHSKYGLDGRGLKPELLPLNSQGPVQAAFETPGVIKSLCFKPYDQLLRPLPPDFIDVTVAAVGLNSRDIDHWTGRVNENHFSSEYAGVVTAVGAAVEGFKIGDRVYGLGKGQFSNHTRVPAAFASKLRPDDNTVQMASMPLAYATSMYALDNVAHLRKGQSVLIQSAAKDVGLAFIRLARAKGAEVFAMVETTEQANFLTGELAMPATHVTTESTLAALQHATQVSGNSKFDVIVSTARDELLYSFLQVLAPLGHLIDVNRSEVQAAPAISLDLLPYNASYCSVDSMFILDSDPALGAELIQALDRYYRDGVARPIEKIEAPDISQLQASIENFSDMIGKLVVSFENPESLVRMLPAVPTARFDPESCYILVGALGGLGQSLVRWLGDRGARHLALLSRRDISSVPGAQEFVQSLASCDIHVESFVCDISKIDQVTSVVQNISSKRPVKGVVHAAVSYLDLTFDKLSPSRWNESISAKVEGTKNLHEATLSMPLDFFVMITSALSVYAFPTQGAYTAANNFQDAFARYRRKIGLPASTASFSLIRGATNVGTSDTTINLFERNKALTLEESQFLTLIEPAFLNNQTITMTTTEEKASSDVQWLGQQDDPLSAANLHAAYLDPSSMMARRREEQASDAPASSGATPRWYSDGRVSLIMRAFADLDRRYVRAQASLEQEEPKNTAAALRKEFDAAVGEGAAGRARTVSVVRDAIVRAVADMLFVDVESIDPHKSVADLGVDSLIAAELRSWMLQALRTNISMLDLLDPSVDIGTRAVRIVDLALEAKA